MIQRSGIFFKMPILFLIQFILLISKPLVRGSDGFTQSELKAKYGQDGTTFNDGKSCHRDCTGESKTCYYEFNAQVYDTMSGLCGGCANGTIKDCFNEGCVPANGVERIIMTVNQQLPAKDINVCRGDRIIVDVTNHMAGQGLTIHWHGLHQRESPWYDGVPMVTQCPINAGNSFRYIFKATEAGTLVYHAHSGLHRSNGLVGKLIVREANDPNANLYDYDLAEHSVLLLDWNNVMAEDREPGLRSTWTLPDSILINGFGNYLNPKINAYTFAPIAAFYVQRSKRHRFRFANAGTHICPLEITIRDHKLTVIATDGTPIEPIVVDSLVALPGERYDVIMDATTLPEIRETILIVRGLDICKSLKLQEFARIIFVYDIFNHTTKLEDHQPLKERPDYGSQDFPKSILNYPLTDCMTSDYYCVADLQRKNSLKVEDLRNVSAEVIPLHFQMVTVQKRPHNYLNFLDNAYVTLINRIASVHPPIPGLIQDDSDIAYCNAKKIPKRLDTAMDGQPVAYCPHVIELKLGQVYEFLMVDDDPSYQTISHPMHLHGYSFQVIDMGTREQLENGTTAFTNATYPPVIKDTVAVPSGGFVRIRFRATNPGYWIFHCHFEYHVNPGMGLVLKTGDRKEMPKPPANFPTCGNYLQPFSGRATALSTVGFVNVINFSCAFVFLLKKIWIY